MHPREQEREVVLDLSNAVGDAARAFESCRNSMNRLDAATRVLEAYDTQERNDLEVDIDRLLDAQRRVVDAEIRYFQARSEYAVALKNVHLEKGSLMAYNELGIFDGECPLIRETVEIGQSDSAQQVDCESPPLMKSESDSAPGLD